MTADDRDAFAAAYVLGLLDPREMQEAERLLAEDPAYAAHVADWRERLSELDRTAPSLLLPQGLWTRIEAGLDAPATAQPAAGIRTETVRAEAAWLERRAQPERKAQPEPALSRLWRSLGFWRGIGLAASAAAVLLSVALGVAAVQLGRKPAMIAVLLTDSREPAAVVHTFGDGRAELVPLAPIDVPAGRALEIWTLWDRARGPVSIGLIDEARTVRLNLDELPRTDEGQLFEITLEPSTGSPTGRPTGPILMKGTASAPL